MLCGIEENADHVLFQCVLARFVWHCVKEILIWGRIPGSLDDLHLNWLDKRGANDYHIGLFSFAALAWTLWKIRNKMVIEKTFPKQPIEVIVKFVTCLQRWRMLTKEADRMKVEDFLSSAEDWLKKLCAMEDV